MEFHDATLDDREEICEVARKSIEASYALSPQTMETLLETEFGEDRLETLIETESAIVARGEEGTVGFFLGTADDEEGTIEWIHVATEARGQGVGRELYERGTDRLHDRGAETIRAEVLADNAEGRTFLESFGLEADEQRDVEIGEETFSAHVYTEGGSSDDVSPHTESEPVLEAGGTVEDAEGRTIYLGEEELPGEQGPFYVAYEGEEREEPYSFACANCGTLVEAVDSLDRVECGECGNLNAPDEWDGSYL
ncbi:GNAT family N-acetyltransferase [Natronorarus salvus]|uniref:GNAT family N-acetyltransferase n=1 Tax=Natronorarus salvus TaxID=3117733 RepID=UPI002F26B205